MDDAKDFQRADMRVAAGDAADLLRALSNRTRLMILCELCKSERTVGELEKSLDLAQAYVSQQLAHLRSRDLVTATRDGRQMRYRLADMRVLPIVEAILREFCPDVR